VPSRARVGISAPAAADRPTSQRLLLVTLALLTTVTAVVSSLGAPLVPSVAQDYDVPIEGAQWTLTVALLCGAVATPVIGRLGSGRLRRPTILMGLVVVTAGNALAALPLGFPLLIVGRGMQGVGMALLPLAIAVARDVLPGHRLPGAVAFLSVTAVAGAGLGYPLTALVAQEWGLHGAFWLGTILTGSTLVMAIRFVPPAVVTSHSRVDWAGAAMLSIGVVLVLLAVSQGGAWGWVSIATLASGVAGVVVLVVWAGWTLRQTNPLVDLRLAIRPGLAGPNLFAVAAGMGMYTILTLVMVLVQTPEQNGWGFGEPVIVAGLVLVPYSVMSVLGSRLARVVGRVHGPQALLPIGCLLFLSATITLALEHDQLWQVFACMALAGLGSGFTFSSLAVLMIPHVPRLETSSAMALNQILRYLGFSLGSSVSLSLLALFGGGQEGFRAALLITSAVWVLAGGGTWLLDRARGNGAPRDLRGDAANAEPDLLGGRPETSM
jgi:MFS family permease